MYFCKNFPFHRDKSNRHTNKKGDVVTFDDSPVLIFANDSVFFKIVAPDLMLMDYQYLWAVTESEAVEKGLTKEYYKRVKKEITDTNEAIKRGVMKGANVKRIPDFQASQENK